MLVVEIPDDRSFDQCSVTEVRMEIFCKNIHHSIQHPAVGLVGELHSQTLQGTLLPPCAMGIDDDNELVLLLHQQPVARDLRQISSALKMISDMERIGDQALDIAEICEYLLGHPHSCKTHLQFMAQQVIHMVTVSVDAYIRQDPDMARAVIAYDDKVDESFERIKRELIALIAEDSSDGEYYLDLLMVAKYLERIGDHATNIGEWVEYSITGSHNN